MILRVIAMLLLLPLLIGSSSSSNSTFVLEFTSSSATSDALISAAISSLEQSGFHRAGSCCSDNGIELQYGHRPVFVYVSSSTSGQLQLSFEELRGGCSSIPEVAGAKDIATRVRSNIESRFGPAVVTEAHAANRRPQPNFSTERDAPQAATPLAERPSP